MADGKVSEVGGARFLFTSKKVPESKPATVSTSDVGQGVLSAPILPAPKINEVSDVLIHNLARTVMARRSSERTVFFKQFQERIFSSASVKESVALIDRLFLLEDKRMICNIVGCLVGLDDGIFSARKEAVYHHIEEKLEAVAQALPKSSATDDDGFFSEGFVVNDTAYGLSYLAGYLRESKYLVFERKFLADRQHQLKPHERRATLFLDEEIVKRSGIIFGSAERIMNPDQLFCQRVVSEHGKTVIQQQAKASCVNTCIAMLLYDLECTPDPTKIYSGHYTEPEDQAATFHAFGFGIELLLLAETSPRVMLQQLQRELKCKGSCLIDISGDIGGHELILDAVSDDLSTVRIRDPYHGWEITVKSDAFLKRIIAPDSHEYKTKLVSVHPRSPF